MQLTWATFTRCSVNGSQGGLDITIQVAADQGDSLGAMAGFAIRGIDEMIAALPVRTEDSILHPAPAAASRPDRGAQRQAIRTEHDARAAAAGLHREFGIKGKDSSSQEQGTP